MVKQLLYLEQYYHRLIMESLERVDLVARDLCKLKDAVLLSIDEDAIPVDKLSTSLLVYVVDLSAILAVADVISD